MSDIAEGVEERLLAAYAEEADCYDRAVRLAETFCGTDFQAVVPPILALLNEIAVREASIAEVKERWRQSGRRAGPKLGAVMDRIAATIEQLRRHMGKIEEAARARRDRLAVELDDCNRRRRMQRAYSRKS